MKESTKHKATQELVDLYTHNKEIYHEGCPDFINKWRESAIERFGELGIPSNKIEEYKYSNLQPVFDKDYSVVPRYLNQDINLLSIFKCDVPSLQTQSTLFINGWFYKQNQPISNLPDGVIIDSIQNIANKQPELLEKYYNQLAKDHDDALTHLNTALAKDGLFFYVPDNVTIEKPIQFINLIKKEDNLFSIQKNVFVIGKNSEAKVVFCDHALNENNNISSNVNECFVDKDARFELIEVQNQHNNSANLTATYVNQEQASNASMTTITLHGGVVRNNLEIKLNGEHCETGAYGLALTDCKQHVDNATFIDHKQPNCRSNQLYKYILDDQSSGAFSGRIHVNRDAQKTLAFQSNNNVLMSETAKMNTKPQLVIDADDVRCSHGATVGRIDEDALFYLKARGIKEKEARLMLMFAFADEVFEHVSIPPLKERISQLVDSRLRRELSLCHNCIIDCEK